jgi:hypothetical protein
MAETKYGKYIITELKPGLDIPEFRSESADRMTHVRWLGDDVIKGSPHMECVWIWKQADSPGPAPHTHDFDEILGFFGTNPEDVHDLGGEMEIWLEDEKHVINKSCIIFIPKGMKHCPLRTTRLDRPIFHFVVGTASKYSGKTE